MRVKSPSVFAACFLDRCETRSDLNFWRILKVKEKREPPRGKGGQHGLIDKRFRTKRIVTLREYIYIYTLDVLYTVPTVFLGLNKAFYYFVSSGGLIDCLLLNEGASAFCSLR